MPLRHALLLALFSIILLGSCKKQDAQQEKPTIDFGPGGGFLFRSQQNIEGPGDGTDWIADGPWNATEKNLFSNLNLSLDNVQLGNTWYFSAYPNPFQTQCNFVVRVDSGHPAPVNSRLAYVVVDRYYKEMQRGEVSAVQTMQTPILPTDFVVGNLYRIYYVCYVPGQQVYFRSHGDIKKE